METAYADRINSAPVVFLTLKNCTGKSVSDIEQSIGEELRNEYEKYKSHFSEVDMNQPVYLRYYETLEALNKEQIPEKPLKYSLKYLVEALHSFYGVNPIVLIDEYDNPIIEAHQKGFRSEFTGFYAAFLTTVLKGNPHLGQALLTGIQRVAKESIFSKLNNILVYNVLSRHFSPYFGLTSEETSELLVYYGFELNDDVKSLYDGYLFHDIEMYNPWSILNYAYEGELKNYWINTSTNVLVKESVLAADYDFHESFEELIANGEVTVRANLEASFAELPRTDTLWGLFVNAGYLTVTQKDFRRNRFVVRVPNEEIKTEFEEIVSAYTKLSSLLLQDMLMLGMLMQLRELYDITSNIEAEHGRSDITMKSKDAKRPHIIIEFKQGENVEKLKYEALEQIKEKNYYAGLNGSVLCVGVAHDKKKCELVHEMLTV